MMIRVDDETAAALEETRTAVGAASASEVVRMFAGAAGAGAVREALVAQRDGGGPRAYLSGLAWDGKPRLDRVAEELFGDGSEAAAAGVREWMLSAVARAFAPGIRLEKALLVCGRQGSGKSQVLRALGGDLFVDGTPKSVSSGLARAWIFEIPFDRCEAAAVKAFMLATTDVFKAPYQGKARCRPRQFVVAATTLASGPPEEMTRRFWVVRVGAGGCDVEKARAWRDQVWAEAVAVWREQSTGPRDASGARPVP